jgi:hypothetical protein
MLWEQDVVAVLQAGSVGIGLLLTAWSIHEGAKARQIENLIRITDAHRALWTYQLERPELHRVMSATADLHKKPLTEAEEWFMGFLVNHLIVTFEANKKGQYRYPPTLRADIKDFFTRSVPHAAWQRIKPFQEPTFVQFVEKCIEGKV